MLKTRKSVAKRFKITGTGKLVQRTGGQDHFNARERSKVTRAKRRDHAAHETIERTLRRAMPFS